MKKKIISLGVLFLVGIISYIYFIYANQKSVRLVTNEQGLFLEMSQDLVEELNKLPKNELAKTEIDFYVANFSNNSIPEIKDENSYNILYLGSRKVFNSDAVQKFNKIFVSTPELQDYLNQLGIKSDFLQISWKNKGKFANLENKNKWLLIGENPETEQKIQELGVQYDKINSFALENEVKILGKLSEVKGVIVENMYGDNESLDFSPLILEIISRKIPILSSLYSLSYYFNDEIYYYNFEKDKLEHYLRKKVLVADHSYQFYDNLYSSKSVAKCINENLKNNKFAIQNSISIRHAIESGVYNNGDYWLAKDLQKLLESNGYYVHTFFYNSIFKNMSNTVIYIGGEREVNEPIKSDIVSIMYLLFPGSFLQEIEKFNKSAYNVDAIISSSQIARDTISGMGIKSYYLPQFTNKDTFYPDYDENLQSEILFIGNNYIPRKSPQIALNYNFPITIYGNGWQGMAKAEYADNRILRKYYSSAKINLNDHHQRMNELGFINNRTYDVTASGGFLISDYVEGLWEVYGDSIPMWKTEEELVEMLNYYLNPEHEQERQEKAKRAQEITLKNFTSEVVGQKFIDIINELKKEKGIDN